MRHVTLAAGLGALLLACATGAVIDPLDLGDQGGDAGDGNDPGTLTDAANGNDTGGPSYGSNDAGRSADTSVPDTASPDTGGAVDSAVDSAPPPPPPPPPPTGLDCSGTYSSQVNNFGLPVTYNSACDNFFQNGGGANTCTPGGNDCAALNGQGGYNPFCCFKPSTGSSCYSDYGGKAQCIPQ
jgi:hypothetical protein